MSTRGTRRRTVSLLLALALTVSGWVAVGGSHVAVAKPVLDNTSSSLVQTAVAGYHFEQLEFAQLPVNSTINVTFYNDDSTGNPHTFTILNRSDWVIPTGATNLTQLISQHHTLVDLSADAGNTTTGSFRSPGPGWYEFVCRIAGHFGLGMYGFIAFGMNLPSNLTVGVANPGPGLAVFIIVGTIVGLTVLSLVLGFVFGRREGAVHEMPPERLGYREPPAMPPHTPEPPRPDS